MPVLELPAILDGLHDLIRHDLAAGFAPPTAIVAAAIELFSDDAHPTLLRPHANRILRTLLAEHRAEQARWPAVTDCDRLDAAFADLEAAGIVCRHNFSCCGPCGAAAMWNEIAAQRRAGGAVRGYAFYHRQDLERALAGDGLYLNYGAVDEGEAAALGVAREVIAVLEHHGLRTEWNGEWSRRIGVALDWKRRRVVEGDAGSRRPGGEGRMSNTDDDRLAA